MQLRRASIELLSTDAVVGPNRGSVPSRQQEKEQREPDEER